MVLLAAIKGNLVATKLERTYPAYQGHEPYVHLCFSPADTALAATLLAALRERGVRVWYSLGKTADKAILSQRQSRANNSSLLVLVLTDAARQDRDVKGTALFQLSRGKPIVCIDADHADKGLSMGLPADLAHVDAWHLPDAHATCEALMRCEGFSYDLIGEPAEPATTPTRGRALTLALLALAALLVAMGLAGASMGWFVDDSLHAGDTLALESPELIVAARAALEGGDITAESAATVRVLRLSSLPDDLSELDAFSGLERLEIPQDQAARATALLGDAAYEIVLVG